jgi:pentatricopeptide repeat protein
MKERWFTLTPDGWHNLVVGLLRDRQYEVALDKLDEMQEEGLRIQPWLYDIVLYQLCEIGELDEAVKILQGRVSKGEQDISANIWHFMLDACSSAFHFAGTRYVWQKRVETSYINPSDGICINVLNTAARHKDSSLATDVIRVLAARSTRLEYHHYEALLEAYVGSDDLKTAFRVLCIMKRARLEPDEGSTRSLYVYLCGHPSRPNQAYEIVKSLHEDGQVVPTAAFNVILEASSTLGALDTAVAHYKTLHLLCADGPTTGTFNALLQGCHKVSESTQRSNKDLAMFLASEMAALGIRPDSLTYDRFILVCLQEPDYEDAFRYLAEMKSMGAGKWRPRQGTYNALVRRAAASGDDRVDGLLQEMEAHGLGTARLKKFIEDLALGTVEEKRRASI